MYKYMNQEFQDIQAGFRKGRGTRDQIANILRLQKKQESSRKTFTSALLTTPKPLTVDHNKQWKILKETGIPDHVICLLRNPYASQEATEQNMEQWTGSKLRKEYVKAVYCQPAYLTYFSYY